MLPVARFGCVSRKRASGDEVPVALEAQAQQAAEPREFGQADIAQLRDAQPQIAQPEAAVGVVRVDLCEQLGAAGIRREELHDGEEVDARFRLRVLSLAA